MALRDLWQGRERHGEDRDRQWGRSMSEDWRGGEDWRDESRYGHGERDESRQYGSSYGRDYEGGEYRRGYGSGYGGSQGYGSGYGGSPAYGGSYGGSQGYGGSSSSSQGYGRAGGYGGMQGSASGGTYEYGMGQHRGRGPRGYQRSDERIREDVCERLTDDPDIDASNLEVTVKGGEVTLSGTVNSREDKRRAEECAEDISGVKDVHNSLRVSMEQRGGEQQLSTQTTEQTARH